MGDVTAYQAGLGRPALKLVLQDCGGKIAPIPAIVKMEENVMPLMGLVPAREDGTGKLVLKSAP